MDVEDRLVMKGKKRGLADPTGRDDKYCAPKRSKKVEWSVTKVSMCRMAAKV